MRRKSFSFLTFAVALALAVWVGIPTLAASEGPLLIGEHLRDTVLQTPHPYPSAGGSDPRLVWTERYDHPGAEYLVFEFSRFDLAPGDWVEVRDPAGKQLHVYRDRGFKDKGGDFITKMILGDEARIDLYSTNPRNGHYGYRIERITRGFNQQEMAEREETAAPDDIEAVCGTDDQENAACYETTFPDVYEEARAVSRIVMDGAAMCTAWLVSCENHVITNNHCTWDDADFDTQGELDRMEFQFMYEDATCGGGGASFEYSFMGGTWLENDHGLDYTLIQAPEGENPAATYGWLVIDNRLADIDEWMYIVGHPSGRPKEISLYSTESADQDNPDGFCEVFSQNEPPCTGGPVGDIGYFCDTEGGSSGSPVLSRNTHKVIALHHCAFCPNRGVRIQPIWTMNQAGPNPLPACSLIDEIGSVEFDRNHYGCSDTITIEVSDQSIQGAGSQAVTVWSGTEPTPETVTLTETPPDSGTFTGAIPTTPAAPSAGDGSLSVTHSDAITVRYIDADDGQGGLNLPREDSAVGDCVEPAISGVDAIDIGGTTARIVWTTDEPASSEVFHADEPSPWTQTVEEDLVLDHSVVLSGLNECTLHDYWVRSTDEAGGTATEDNLGNYYSLETHRDIQQVYAYPGPPESIPDVGSINSVISVTAGNTIQDLDVQIDITHTFTDDLDIYLIGPNAVAIALTMDNGGNGDDFAGTIFDDEAALAIAEGSAPFAGRYRPKVPLSTFDGVSLLGDWQLRIVDDSATNVGALNDWNLLPTVLGACGPVAEQTGALFLDRDTLTWTADPGALDGYTVYRGTKAGLEGLTHAGLDSCVRFTGYGSDDNVADLSDDNPATVLGRLNWYLVTGRNSEGEGPAGHTAEGVRQVDPTGNCPGNN